MVASENVPVAVNCCVCPGRIVFDLGVTAIEANTAAVTETAAGLLVFPPNAAVTLTAAPVTATPVMLPLDSVATPSLTLTLSWVTET